MKTIRSRPDNLDAVYKTQKGCLLRYANFVSNFKSASFEERQNTWEASTLPLSYTRIA